MIRGAESLGGLDRLHQACAQMLAGRRDLTFEERQRLGVHLSHREPERAWNVLESLCDDLMTAMDAGRLSLAVRHLDRLAADFVEADPRWVPYLLIKGSLRVGSSDLNGGIATFEDAVDRARRHRWPSLARALRKTAHSLVQRRDAQRAPPPITFRARKPCRGRIETPARRTRTAESFATPASKRARE